MKVSSFGRCLGTLMPTVLALLWPQHHRNAREQPQCSKQWGTYPDAPVLNASVFVRTQTSRIVIPDKTVRDLFVHPPSKFAFCWIPKVGSEQWNIVLTRVLYNNRSFNGGKHWGIVDAAAARWPTGFQDVFNDPNAVRAVFVRDPIKRFVSAFLDKCLHPKSGPNGGRFGNCPAHWDLSKTDSNYNRSTDLTFRSVVDWIQKADLNSVNIHWRPQSHFCELRDRIRQFTVLGYMEKDTYANDASCLLDLAGLSNFKQKSDWLIPKINVHTSSTQDEERMMQKYVTRPVAEKIMDAYYEDYNLFHFDRNPSWLEGATGELYDAASVDI